MFHPKRELTEYLLPVLPFALPVSSNLLEISLDAPSRLSLDTNAGTGTLAVTWGGPTDLPVGQCEC